MANPNAEALNDLTPEELFQRLAEAKDQLFHLRFQHATGQLEKTSQLSGTKRDIARLNTELREREIAAADALAAQEASA